MLDLAFKNIMRQKTRTILTTMGILIGIGAIVALGSVAEGLDAAIQSGLELTAGKITVMDAEAGFFGMGGELTQEHLDIIEDLGGIKEVVPINWYMSAINPMQGPEWMVIGIEPEKIEYMTGENVEFEEGRTIEEGESGVAIVGSTTAGKYDLHVGDTWEVKEEDFEIIGVLEETGISDTDTSIIVTFDDLQDVLEEDTFQMLYVIPDDIKDVEAIAEDIEDANDRFNAMTTQEMARQAGAIVDQVRMFTFGIGAIAALVGGLGVMNTMIMAVMERRREIGVMKAIGATNAMVLKQIIMESAMISFLGGVGGVLIGLLGAVILSNVIGGGAITATVTPGLAATGIGFALFLGIVGGLYPARKASVIDPVEALRYE